QPNERDHQINSHSDRPSDANTHEHNDAGRDLPRQADRPDQHAQNADHQQPNERDHQASSHGDGGDRSRHANDQHDSQRPAAGHDSDPAHTAVDRGQAGAEHGGEQSHVPSYGARGQTADHHVMSVEPGAATPYSAAAFSPGFSSPATNGPAAFSSMATNGSAGLAPSLAPTLNDPVNTGTAPANAAIVTTASAVPSQPGTTTPVSSA